MRNVKPRKGHVIHKEQPHPRTVIPRPGLDQAPDPSRAALCVPSTLRSCSQGAVIRFYRLRWKGLSCSQGSQAHHHSPQTAQMPMQPQPEGTNAPPSHWLQRRTSGPGQTRGDSLHAVSAFPLLGLQITPWSAWGPRDSAGPAWAPPVVPPLPNPAACGCEYPGIERDTLPSKVTLSLPDSPAET